MRLFLRFVAFLTFILLISGCSPFTDKDEGDKIVVWHWMNDRDDALKNLAEIYEKEKGIEVEFKLFSPPDIYSQKVIAAARAGNLPDIFGILGEKKILASFIKAGYILKLTPYMKNGSPSWEERFFPQALGVVSFKKNNVYTVEEGIYGVPIDITVLEFLYNKSLFEEVGLDKESPPATFNEFIDYAKKIEGNTEASGFICGWGESWLLYALAIEWAFNTMGEEKFIKTLQGEVPYTDNDWIEVFSMFKKMRE
ncbi:MAG: extracellular solute-binding protein, partial [Candidatus Omnitrophica bacterium]|nr:extracellular solute-binding protein [Candidatus Omnitrophota bacterium]MBD3269806.1 extracellular solute-binding protein [Candidatus Omnitrophota bacterium]